MKATVHPGRLSGRVAIPGSKSHTIRALLVAALAESESVIRGALDSEDTAACVRILRDLGVKIDGDFPAGGASPPGGAPPGAPGDGLDLRVVGRSGVFDAPAHPLDCANSGTTLYLALSLAALQNFPVSFTGDEQLQRRSAGPLLRALESAGARVTREGTGDCVPLTVHGPLEGGEVTIECPTSQYLSSLLLAAPLSRRGLDIRVPLLNERPYVELTLSWLESQSIAYSREGWDRFTIPGGQAYGAFDRLVPADFSSATFFLVAGALSDSPLEITGLDMNDSQGDRGVVRVLERLGCRVNVDGQFLTIAGPAADEPRLAGGDVDLNAMPDALPALAVLGTRCATPLRLVNVPQAREKETDRIDVMAKAITALGGRVDELPDGLVVHPCELAGASVDSAGDHRVAMALAIAGLVASSAVTITNAGVAGITFPGFYEKLAACGARVEEE